MRPLFPILAGLFALQTAFGETGGKPPLFDYRAHPDRKGGVEIHKDLVYGTGAIRSGAAARDLLADAFVPKGLDGYRKAAILFIHGGGFVSGDKTDYREECRYFARKGFVTFSINYRMRGDEPPLVPGESGTAAYARPAIVDVKTALRWVRSRAEAFGIDPEMIFLDGTSAGAIVSLAAGVTGQETFATDLPGQPVPASNSPDASIDVRGIIDFCGGLFGVVDSIDSHDPPILIYHGLKDKTVPIAQALAVRDRCLTVGLDYEFYPIEGGGHCPSRPADNGKDLRALTEAFILRLLDTPRGPVLRKASFP